MRTNSGLTSGMSVPAWLRMNATAYSGSMPPEQPAMIEIVPVGATVVMLQLRSRRQRADAVALGPRAQVASGPQMERSHSGNTPRRVASRSDSTLASSSMNPMSLRAELDGGPRSRRDAELHQHVGPAHHAEPDAADVLRQVVDRLQRVLVGIDHVVEEVGRRAAPSRAGLPVHPSSRRRRRRRRSPSRGCTRRRAGAAARRTGWSPRTSPGAGPGCSGWPRRSGTRPAHRFARRPP